MLNSTHYEIYDPETDKFMTIDHDEDFDIAIEKNGRVVANIIIANEEMEELIMFLLNVLTDPRVLGGYR